MDIEDYKIIKFEDENKFKLFLQDLLKNNNYKNNDEINYNINILRRKYKIYPTKKQLRYYYHKYFNNTKINQVLSRYMIKKAIRSKSGVLVCTLVLKPSVFSCPKKCSYCPTETDLNGNYTQPKSYLSSEPAMLRALEYKFDICGQLWDRINAYIKTGNICDNELQNINCSYKLEIILSGGTWESYPYEYRNSIMNEIYWSANIFPYLNKNDNLINNYKNYIINKQNFNFERKILSLAEEIKINEISKFRIIGLTIETRPDFITNMTIKDYCRWGVTRVQIGVQHYDDEILKKINRDCYTIHTKKAIKLLKNCGFKIVCHLMPDLPGSSPELDIWMFNQTLIDPDLQFDDVKIYPTAVCKSSDKNIIVKSDIAEWYENGLYMPYAEQNIDNLINVLIYYKTNIQPWIRIQRLIRDIPSTSIQVGYNGISNLRQIIHDILKKTNKNCNCIRCREIGDNDYLITNTKIVVRKYRASDGDEYFISIETNTININYIIFIIKYYIIFILTGYKIYWTDNFKNNGLLSNNDIINNYKIHNLYKNDYTIKNKKYISKYDLSKNKNKDQDKIIGFCRLRLDNNAGADIINEIKNCALIREAHVYGYSLGINNETNINNSSQHKGYGKLLISTAEQIAINNNYKKIAVISGVGTREYYKNKCNYKLGNTYMIKYINKNILLLYLRLFIIIIALYLYYY
jgi:ELP3 family radical SAM enzyme/protein acetyltransferase